MQVLVEGNVGKIELFIESPHGPAIGVALIGHPQPLLGGTPRHPVLQAIARRLLEDGWICVRPSFRGVDGTEGSYDAGIGEADDMVVVADHVRAQFPGLPLALVGFSFGAHVLARAASLLETRSPAEVIVLLGMPVGETAGGRVYEMVPLPRRALLVHGDQDAIAPLPHLLQWAEANDHSVTVMRGANHFFRHCLPDVLDLISAHLASAVQVGRMPDA